MKQHINRLTLIMLSLLASCANQKSTAIGVSKSGKGVDEKQQATSAVGQKNGHQEANLNKADERWLNIYKSLSFGGACCVRWHRKEQEPQALRPKPQRPTVGSALSVVLAE